MFRVVWDNRCAWEIVTGHRDHQYLRRVPSTRQTRVVRRQTLNSPARDYSWSILSSWKSYVVDELIRFLLPGPTDALSKLSDSDCQICRNDVSVLTQGTNEDLRHFQGSRHFARDQRLRFETPGGRVFQFEGNLLIEGQLSSEKEKILFAPLVVRDRGYPLPENMISDASGKVNPQLSMLAEVSSVTMNYIWLGATRLSRDCENVSCLHSTGWLLLLLGHVMRLWLVL